MKIHITKGDVVVPGLDAFLGGQTYEVPAETGKMLVERGQAEEVSGGEDKEYGNARAETPKKGR